MLITHRGRLATILRRAAADRFLARLDGLDDAAAQQLMARVTGNFKRAASGDERSPPQTAPSTRDAFRPPKPNEVERAARG